MGIGFRDSKREKIFASTGWLCIYCLKSLLNIRKFKRHIDHAIPVSLGGAKYDEENLRPSCNKCNADKGERTETEYLEILALRGSNEKPNVDFNPNLFSGISSEVWTPPQREMRRNLRSDRHARDSTRHESNNGLAINS